MPPDFLISLLARYSQQPPSIRPHVTLTFAQSTDAKIAAIPGKQLILSGDESMQMTHWLRSMHDAILVGIGTALNDDPQLNSRYRSYRLCTLPNSPYSASLASPFTASQCPSSDHPRFSSPLTHILQTFEQFSCWVWSPSMDYIHSFPRPFLDIPQRSLETSRSEHYRDTLARWSFHSRSSEITPRS